MARLFLVASVAEQNSAFQHTLTPEDQVLALNLQTLLAFRRINRNVLSIESLIAYPEIQILAERANKMTWAFAQVCCNRERWNGYDFPRIGWQHHEYFFRDLLLAEKFGSFLQGSSFERVIWVGDSKNSLDSPTDLQNVTMGLLQHMLGDRFAVWNCMPLGASQSKFKTKIEIGIRLVQKYMSERFASSPSPCRVVATTIGSEWERFKTTYLDLFQSLGAEFQIWSLGYPPKNLRNWTRAHGISLVWVTFPTDVDNAIANFFNLHWEKWHKTGLQSFASKFGVFPLTPEILAPFFEPYYKLVMPLWAQLAQKTQKLLKATNPKWVIGSTDYQPVRTLVFHIARALNISSLALPHGFVQVGNGKIDSDYFACHNVLERLHLQAAFPNEKKIIYVQNAGDTLSYEAHSVIVPAKSPRKIVAVLSADTDLPNMFMPVANRLAHADSLDAIRHPPSDLNELDFYLKLHPRYTLASFDNPAPNLEARNVFFVNPIASLIELLERSWAIVLLNYFGSGAVHALLAHKPIIFSNTAHLYWPNTEWLTMKGGVVVEKMSELWNVLRALMVSEEYYQKGIVQADVFRHRYLQSPPLSVSQSLHNLETEKYS